MKSKLSLMGFVFILPALVLLVLNLHVFAQKASGEIIWGVAPHGGKWDVKVLGA